MFHGSLPGRHVFVNDVVGIATTPSDNGYWTAREWRRGLRVRQRLSAPAVPALPDLRWRSGRRDLSNPKAQGWRLVTQSGAAIPFSDAPDGITPSRRDQCTPANPPTMSLSEFQSIATGMTRDQVSNLVGGQATLVSLHSQLGIVFATYRWHGEGAGAYADIYFIDDFEHAKAQHGLG